MQFLTLQPFTVEFNIIKNSKTCQHHHSLLPCKPNHQILHKKPTNPYFPKWMHHLLHFKTAAGRRRSTASTATLEITAQRRQHHNRTGTPLVIRGEPFPESSRIPSPNHYSPQFQGSHIIIVDNQAPFVKKLPLNQTSYLPSTFPSIPFHSQTSKPIHPRHITCSFYHTARTTATFTSILKPRLSSPHHPVSVHVPVHPTVNSCALATAKRGRRTDK